MSHNHNNKNVMEPLLSPTASNDDDNPAGDDADSHDNFHYVDVEVAETANVAAIEGRSNNSNNNLPPPIPTSSNRPRTHSSSSSSHNSPSRHTNHLRQGSLDFLVATTSTTTKHSSGGGGGDGDLFGNIWNNNNRLDDDNAAGGSEGCEGQGGGGTAPPPPLTGSSRFQEVVAQAIALSRKQKQHEGANGDDDDDDDDNKAKANERLTAAANAAVVSADQSQQRRNARPTLKSIAFRALQQQRQQKQQQQQQQQQRKRTNTLEGILEEEEEEEVVPAEDSAAASARYAGAGIKDPVPHPPSSRPSSCQDGIAEQQMMMMYGSIEKEEDEEEEEEKKQDNNNEESYLLSYNNQNEQIRRLSRGGGGGGNGGYYSRVKRAVELFYIRRCGGGGGKKNNGCCNNNPLLLVLWGIPSLVLESVSTVTRFALIPLCVTAWFLYYSVGNPNLVFLPGDATVSWWCNFFARQCVTLELARFTQWLFLDCIMLSALSIRIFGNLVPFYCILSKGWCFVAAAWATWDLILLQGNNQFQTHWFYWTGFKIYSNMANSGTYVIESEFYLRMLVAVIFIGFATATKRTVLAIHFGRRQLAEFKPKLEKILKDISLISEISYIAEEAAALDDAGIEFDIQEIAAVMPRKLGHMSVVKPASFHLGNDDDDDDKSRSDDSSISSGSTYQDGDEDNGDDDDEDEHGEKEVMFDDQAAAGRNGNNNNNSSSGLGGKRMHRVESEASFDRSSIGNVSVRDILDGWEEPVNKADKGAPASIHDVVKFRRVLTHIDETQPFGRSFGPAGDRGACIESAQRLFHRLLKLSPGAAVPFSTISLAAIDERRPGSVDEMKAMALQRLFQPDARNMLPLAPFIQSIDAVYKKIRCFRASVANASVIDNVLERIFNGLFFFGLGLLMLSFMQINPWPLLVSMTSVLVSVSFALGPSVSKYVEGALLIAVRRPYDLGDRIFFSGAQTAENPGPAVSWFVEDINLVNTTLRFAKTNEVSIVSNSSIASARIVNCNRSPDAIVVIPLELHISCLKDGKFNSFQKAMKSYAKLHPRAWNRLLFCRRDRIDTDNEKVEVTLAFSNRNSWQDASRIMLQRSNLLKFVNKKTVELKINYCSPPNSRLLYSGGVLRDGQDGEGGDKANLLKPWNIRNYRDESVNDPPPYTFPS